MSIENIKKSVETAEVNNEKINNFIRKAETDVIEVEHNLDSMELPPDIAEIKDELKENIASDVEKYIDSNTESKFDEISNSLDEAGQENKTETSQVENSITNANEIGRHSEDLGISSIDNTKNKLEENKQEHIELDKAIEENVKLKNSLKENAQKTKSLIL